MPTLQRTTPIMDMVIIMESVGMVVEDGGIIIGMVLEHGIPIGMVVVGMVVVGMVVAGMVVVGMVGIVDNKSAFLN